MIISSLFGAWAVIVAWTWLIKIVIYHDLFLVLPLMAFFYFIARLDEHNKKYSALLAKSAITESFNITEPTQIISQKNSFSQTATYLTSYFMSHPVSDSSLFQTLHESFMRYHRKKHRYIWGIRYFKPILGTIVEVKETIEDFLGTLPYPPPSSSFLMKHRRKHGRKRDQFRFIPILGTIQEVPNDCLAMETGV
ncbi:hypothetical protein NPIL_469571 [Nephila pilipes]|uniref:Uncharacterized protein n=1 Tax=Nephila pilipes TaxID=299642 RepID=A0A8X6TNT8_NEPPI|nr:hypothetical protein NPIL_132921 [Nephila pilipes]GFT47056.1 hypothetical protein NPIL_469571 [Nephila pilipes]